MAARILILDIETMPDLAWVWGLWNQNIGINQIEQVGRMIAFSAKWHGSRQIEFYSDYHDGHDKMVREAHRLLDEADIVVTWNGDRFDLPWMRREFIVAGLTPASPFKSVDLYRTARSQFRFSSNKLDFVAQFLGVGKKVKHDGFDLWLGCIGNDAKSWATMKRYNIGDVKITEKVYDRILAWVPSHPHVGIYSECDGDACPRCGSAVQRRGYAYTQLGKFQRYQCVSPKCGSWSRSGRRIDGAVTRAA